MGVILIRRLDLARGGPAIPDASLIVLFVLFPYGKSRELMVIVPTTKREIFYLSRDGF